MGVLGSNTPGVAPLAPLLRRKRKFYAEERCEELGYREHHMEHFELATSIIFATGPPEPISLGVECNRPDSER